VSAPANYTLTFVGADSRLTPVLLTDTAAAKTKVYWGRVITI